MMNSLEILKMTMPTIAILDGDIIAYRAAFWAESEGIEDIPDRIRKDLKNWTKTTDNGSQLKVTQNKKGESKKRGEKKRKGKENNMQGLVNGHIWEYFTKNG